VTIAESLLWLSLDGRRFVEEEKGERRETEEFSLILYCKFDSSCDPVIRVSFQMVLRNSRILARLSGMGREWRLTTITKAAVFLATTRYARGLEATVLFLSLTCFKSLHIGYVISDAVFIEGAWKL
jgi:hypothetical protein